MKSLVRLSTACVAVTLVCAAASLPALAQQDPSHPGALALPPRPAPMTEQTAPPPQESTHARSAHHTLKLEPPIVAKIQAETGNSPLQGAGPPQGNPPATGAQAGTLMLSPLQGVNARDILLGSASSLGTK